MKVDKLFESEWKVPLLLFVLFSGTIIVLWTDLAEFKDGQKNAITLAAGFLAFIVGLFQYRKSQAWKKIEFLAQEYKAFNEDRYVQRVMYLLDYPISNFQLFADENIEVFSTSNYKTLTGDRIIVQCNYSIVSEALSNKYDDEVIEQFDSKANIIRLSFDKFLYKLGLFQKYIDAGLITVEDLQPYFQYWIEVIKRPKNQKLKNNEEGYVKMKRELIRFMYKYNYPALNKLLITFGTNLDDLIYTHDVEL